MQKERCQVHTWVCEVVSGSLGEIRTFKTLRLEEVEQIEEDPKKAKVICSGNIVCKLCGEMLLPEDATNFMEKIHVLNNKLLTKTASKSEE